MENTFSVSTQRAVALAVAEARNRKHDYIGTEHLFLGLLELAPSIAGRMLDKFNVEHQAVINEIDCITQMGNAPVAKNAKLPFAPWAKKAIEFALEARANNDDTLLDPEHLLLGLLQSSPDHITVVTQSLKNAGVDLSLASTFVIQILSNDTKEIR